ncbi:MAG: hypothetical protein WB679_22530 [Terracidiphilus sp.]
MYSECRHIMPRGTKCKSPALKGRPYCYYHGKLHDYTRDGLRDDKGPVCLASIEDACGIQHALMQIMNSMAKGRLDSREGVRLIYGLQVAIQAIDRVPQTPPQEMVQATACDGIGVDIADPEATVCEPHTDCPTCTNRFGCENAARQSKKSIRDHIDEAHNRPELPEREPLALPATATDTTALSIPPDAAPSPALPGPRIDKQKREADMEARVNKFRTNKHEADRDARAEELARMVADHEIAIEDILALPEGSMAIPIPKKCREEKQPRELCSVGDS